MGYAASGSSVTSQVEARRTDSAEAGICLPGSVLTVSCRHCQFTRPPAPLQVYREVSGAIGGGSGDRVSQNHQVG